MVLNSSIAPALISGVVAAAVALAGQFYFFERNRKEESRRKLYGPLIYNLLLMRVLTSNRENLSEEIKTTWRDPELRLKEMSKHINPLVGQWIACKENIEKLLEEFPGYIDPKDLRLVEKFLDGCVKRSITENGQNWYANEERIDQLMKAIKALQDKLVLHDQKS